LIGALSLRAKIIRPRVQLSGGPEFDPQSREEAAVTIALHGQDALRIKSLRSPAVRIDLATALQWLASKFRRGSAAGELDQSNLHCLRDIGIESREMYDVSELRLKSLRVGPRGP
jgi:hypothetical protein